MLRSMFAGLSGLVNHKTALDVIGNNIANVNTVGFKSSRVTFQDLLSQTLTGAAAPVDGGLGGANGMQVGLGSKLGSIDVSMSQGNLQSTGTFTDLAIEGNGFYVIGDGSSQSNYKFTRAGNFSFDAQGNLVNSSGGHVMGWVADPKTWAINTSQSISDISIPSGITIPAQSTDKITYGYNLNSSAYVEGEAQLQAGNSAGIGSVEGNWTGVVTGVTDPYNKNGTHTIAITPQKVGGERSATVIGASGLISNKYQKVSELIANETARTGATIGGEVSPGSGTYHLSIYVDGTQNNVTISNSDTIESVMEKINGGVAGVTASLADGNIGLKRNVAGDTKTIGVSDTVTANNTGFGIADLLFSQQPSGSAASDFTRAKTSPAVITWGFVPAVGSNGSFTSDTTHLTFASGDTGIVGLNGTLISSDSSGFAEGVAVVKTLAADTHSTTARIYDSLGAARNVILTFERTNANTWGWGAAGVGFSGTGTLSFNQDGKLLSTNGTSVTMNGLNGSETKSVLLDFADITQFSADSSLISTNQDGYAQGNLDSYTINQTGVIVGRFSNGLSRDLAQLSVANFTNPTGLQRLADSTFGETNNSGAPQIGMATIGGRGKVSTGTLEMSNVDIATEFANMIIYQRGFQANAKTISTADDLLNTLVNIKR